MRRALFWTVGVLVLLAAAGYGGREYATRAMSRRAVNPQPLGSATPAAAGIPFARVAIGSGDHTLIGWWVRARADSGRAAPAVLFLHGNYSSLSHYVELQRFFYREGISSFVFDYAGFGASGGTPTLHNAVADAGAAARVFAESAGTARRVAMGSAMGATVLLQALDSIQPHVNGLVIEGVDASVLGSAVREGHVPRFLAPALVDIGDNVAAARRVALPLLAVHSHADDRVPIADARAVTEAVPGRAALVQHWRRGRSALLTSSRACDWAPVLAFVRDGTLPASPVDSTNACDADPARADSAGADSARADSARAAAGRRDTAGAAPARPGPRGTTPRT